MPTRMDRTELTWKKNKPTTPNITECEWSFAGESTELLSGGNAANFIHIEADGFEAGGGICLVHNKPNGVGRELAKLIAAAPAMRKTLGNVLNHNRALKPEYQLPLSLVREIQSILERASA